MTTNVDVARMAGRALSLICCVRGLSYAVAIATLDYGRESSQAITYAIVSLLLVGLAIALWLVPSRLADQRIDEPRPRSRDGLLAAAGVYYVIGGALQLGDFWVRTTFDLNMASRRDWSSVVVMGATMLVLGAIAVRYSSPPRTDATV